MKLVLIFSLLFGLSACVKISDSETTPATTKSPEPVPVKGGIDPQRGSVNVPSAIQVQALPEPHRYQVRLSVHPETQVIQRTMVSKPDSSKLMNIQSGARDLMDDQVVSDQEYLYEQGLIQNGQFVVLQSDKMKIPKDLEIRSEVILTGDDTWEISGRLFIYESGLITTNGCKLVVKVGNLIAYSGTIQSFARGAKAEVGQPGRSGGQIRIQAATATGQLKVEMRGQHGGTGAKGADCKDFSKCPPSPAGYPTNSLAGLPGGDGLPGGNSGSFQLQVTGAHDLLPLVTPEYGLGGSGGVGGAGTQASSGAVVIAEGPQGRSGATGPTGFVERSYIQDLMGQRLL